MSRLERKNKVKKGKKRYFQIVMLLLLLVICLACLYLLNMFPFDSDILAYERLNIDLTVVMEKPKLSFYCNKIKNNISQVLKLSENVINIKASTNEGIGLIGKEEAIAAFCVVLLKKVDNL